MKQNPTPIGVGCTLALRKVFSLVGWIFSCLETLFKLWVWWVIMAKLARMMRFMVNDAIISVNVMKILAEEIEGMINGAVEKIRKPGEVVYREIDIQIDEDICITEDIYSYKGIFSRHEEETIDEYIYKISQLGRRSAFLTIYGIFEYHLEECCKEIIDISKLPLGYNDLKGGTLEKINLVLSKVIFAEPSPNKAIIEHLKSIRNTMAHNNGKLRPSDGAQRKALRAMQDINNGLSLNEYNDINLGVDFLNFAINEFEIYYREIDNALNLYTSRNQ
ncbi:hypothetical protein AB6869_14730 [Rahnella rivi]|uniref:hypothetical protein n=1 Tax=Rahnella rivi TaxID=2816249 RepID=UPI0039BE9DB4